MARVSKSLYDQTLDVLSNVLFPVVVFLIWSVATIIGTVVDQNQAPEQYYAEYPMAVANAILRLHLTNVFHSVPYISLVVLLLVSMSVCTFRRVIPKRFPKDRAVPIENFGLHASVEASGHLTATAQAAGAYFRRRGFRIRTQEIDGARWMFAHRHKWGRYGVLVAHLGFTIIALGVFLGWWRGFRGELQIFNGQMVAVAHTDRQVTLKNFTADFVPVQTPDGVMYQASKFQSDLTVRSPDGVAKPSVIVNFPYVTPDHVYFYQASYGYGGHLLVRRHGKPVALPGTNGRLMPRDGVFLPGTSRAIEYGTMVGPSDPSQLPIGMPLPKTDTYALWVFHDQIPTTDKPILLAVGKTIDAGDGYAVTALPPVAWSGLTYRYDPGELWVGAGALVLTAGFVMALFFLPVKLYARVRAAAGGIVVDFAATTTKGNAIYEEDFAAMAKGLSEYLARNGRSAAEPDAVEAYA